MKIERVLLTGDDGYNSTGTRILLQLLKDTYDLTIAGTNSQQSGVGGKMSLAKGFDWGQTTFEGIPAYWVDGAPVDSIELVNALEKEKFDLVISGINWGANLGAAVFGSGTINAALRSLGSQVAQKAIACSWDLPAKYYTYDHPLEHAIDEYLDYPGQRMVDLIELAAKNDFWGAPLLNVNFPQHQTQTIRITEPLIDINKLYNRDADEVSMTEKHYTYRGGRIADPQVEKNFDAQALADGCISVTPCKFNILEETVYSKNAGKEFMLPMG